MPHIGVNRTAIWSLLRREGDNKLISGRSVSTFSWTGSGMPGAP